MNLKTPSQIEIMKEGGRITASALDEILRKVRAGVSLEELEEIAQEEIRRRGAVPAFQRVPGYDFATCLNVNEGIVHGVPSKRKLKEGDILSVDLGAYYKGLNTDSSWTVFVGDESKGGEKVKFLKTGEKALEKAISQARVGNKIGDISQAMQEVLEEEGYTPVDKLVGHGIGVELHEDPQVPCLVIHGKGPKIEEGMTLAVEVIYTNGGSDLEVLEDEWTIVTADGSLSGLFEHTVVVTREGPIILTARE